MRKPKNELRSFGLVVGGVFLALGVLLLWRSSWASLFGQIATVLGLGLLLFGLLLPRALKHVYRGWMAFALVLGWINTRLILGVLFYVGFSLAHLYLLIRRQDPMQRRPDSGRSTYWNDVSQRELTPSSLEHPFEGVAA